jgi:hypothetical protein
VALQVIPNYFRIYVGSSIFVVCTSIMCIIYARISYLSCHTNAVINETSAFFVRYQHGEQVTLGTLLVAGRRHASFSYLCIIV